MKEQIEKVIKQRGLGALSAYHVSVLLGIHPEGEKFMADFKKRKVTGRRDNVYVCVCVRVYMCLEHA